MLQLSGRPLARLSADAYVVAFHSEGHRVVAGPGVEELGAAWGVDLSGLARADRAFTAAPGQLAVLLTAQGVVLAVGLGAEQDLDAGRIRDAAMTAARRLRGYRRLVTTLCQLGSDSASAIRATAEGLLLGFYEYRRPGAGSASAREAPPERVTLVVSDSAGARAAGERIALRTGSTAGGSATWVRQLVETPGSDLSPTDFAEVLQARAREVGVAARLWSGRALVTKGFGGVRGVGAGSRNAPVVVELRAGAGSAASTLGLAGKGITFDSGGLNLKRDSDEIAWMKADMAGAAAVAGAVFGAAELGAGTPVRAILALAENMPGGGAGRPGDVLTHPGGRTTEVTDTDCEGRLILADAVAYLATTGPAAIIDVGTLTDGGGVGNALWGCWGTDRELAADLLRAGDLAGEPGWELPLRQEYEQYLSSPVADIVNCSLAVPDSGQLAATYLRTFAGSTPWLHVDNGSSAYLELDRPPWPKGATGSPTRALLQLLVSRSAL